MIRDFAPAFASDPSGKRVLIDPIYTKGFFDFVRQQGTVLMNNTDHPLQEFDLRLYASHPFSEEDKFPVVLARYIRQEFGASIAMVRPPLLFEGGDLIYDGLGTLFVSQRTLFLNGGDEDHLTKVFQEFYGVRSVHYLRELPWNLVNHLDYVMKFTDSKTLLIAEPYGELIDNEFRRRISWNIREALAFNKTYLNLHFPELEIISVPLIPAARDSEADFLNHVLRRLYCRVAYQLGLIPSEDQTHELNGLGEPEMQAIVTSIERETGFSDVRNPKNLDPVVQHYFSSTLEEFRSVYVDRRYYFRSYLNSLYLKNAQGKERFILPRYRPQSAEEASYMTEVETLVKSAYIKARPGAEIVWIDCDVIASNSGAIHCITQVLPKWPESSN